jgi:hypothetical protein
MIFFTLNIMITSFVHFILPWRREFSLPSILFPSKIFKGMSLNLNSCCLSEYLTNKCVLQFSGQLFEYFKRLSLWLRTWQINWTIKKKMCDNSLKYFFYNIVKCKYLVFIWPNVVLQPNTSREMFTSAHSRKRKINLGIEHDFQVSYVSLVNDIL